MSEKTQVIPRGLPRSNSQVWTGQAAPSRSFMLDRKAPGMANKGGHHHTHPLKQRTLVEYGKRGHLSFHQANLLIVQAPKQSYLKSYIYCHLTSFSSSNKYGFLC